MVRQITSRVSPKLLRCGLAAAAVLVTAVGVLAVSGSASADNSGKQISIMMHPNGYVAYRAVSVCGFDENNEEECVYLTHHGDATFYNQGVRFHGQVEVAAERSSGRAWEFKTFTICESQSGDWATLLWWDPLAVCPGEGLSDPQPGIPLTDLEPGTPLPGYQLRLKEEEPVSGG